MNRTLGYGLLLLGLAVDGSAGKPAFAAGYSFSPGPGGGHGAGQSVGGYLGVDLRDLSEDQVTALRQRDTRGAEIVLVDHDAPAGKAGLREHDIVLRINGQSVANQDQARRMLHDCTPSSTVVLSISRDGRLLTVSARMSTREEVEHQAWIRHVAAASQQTNDSSIADTGNSSPALPAPALAGRTFSGNAFMGSLRPSSSYTGAVLQQVSAQLAQFFGCPSGAGLLVSSVVDNSPAANAGLHAGDVVIRANGKPIFSTGDWAKAVKGSHGRALEVVVLRDKQEQTLTLTPEGKHRSSLEELFESPERTVVAHLNLNWLPRP